MNLAIAILMKDLSNAKTRLEPVLGSDMRKFLARCLFEHSLQFFRQCYVDKKLAVVTPSPSIADMARQHDATALHQEEGGINEAAQIAARWALSLGSEYLLIIHADIAVLQIAEIDQMMETARKAAVVIAASHDGGSNALLLSPPDVIAPHFGHHSARAHVAAAQAAHVPYKLLHLPYLSHDIDRPQDLVTTIRKQKKPQVELFAVPGLPEVKKGDDLAALIIQAITDMDEVLYPHDVVIVAQKIVSKSEGQLLPLEAFSPSEQAQTIADDIGKDPRKVEAILSQSERILRMRAQVPEGLLITRHKKGWICANAGIDQSNLGEDKENWLLLLPQDPDTSAAKLRDALETGFSASPIGVIISDSFGRPWRQGQVNIALGLASVPAVVDWRTRTDGNGRTLRATMPAFADELAASSGLLSLKDAGLPVIVVRGLDWQASYAASGQDFLRPLEQELFV